MNGVISRRWKGPASGGPGYRKPSATGRSVPGDRNFLNIAAPNSGWPCQDGAPAFKTSSAMDRIKQLEKEIAPVKATP